MIRLLHPRLQNRFYPPIGAITSQKENKMATAAVFGSTGAVGSKILETLLTSDTFTSIKTISRRSPTRVSSSPKLQVLVERDTSKWGAMLPALQPSSVFDAVGTTRALAGSIQNQWAIDHDLCIETAKAAKAAGVRTYVYISSHGTRTLPTSLLPYSKMKVGVEEAIRKLEFEQAIILRPGMILGERETPKAPFWEGVMGNLHRISQGLQDRMGQEQIHIGRAAVVAAQMAEEGHAPSKYWVVESSDILKMGRDEWKK